MGPVEWPELAPWVPVLAGITASWLVGCAIGNLLGELAGRRVEERRRRSIAAISGRYEEGARPGNRVKHYFTSRRRR